jgi:membrane protease YdiL (CAAX protease family)
MRPHSPTRRSAGFMIYLFAFFTVWTGWVIVLYPRMLRLGDRTLAYAVVNVTVRLLVWVAPVLLYLRFVDHENPIAYLKLTKNWQKGIGMGILVTFINLLGSWLRFGTPHPSANSVTWSSMFSTAWLIGFIEEVPFRGFILQKLEERIGHALAIVTSSTLFLAIHLPGWIVLNTLRPENAITIFIIGVVLAVIFKYSGSLWSAIIAHTSNNFIAGVLFGR